VVLLEQEPRMEGCATLLDYVLSGSDAPPRHEAEAIADQLGIDLSREAKTASGGERRRAAIARALAQNPDVLLLDEPTVGVDPLSRRELWEIVTRLVREDGLTVIVST
ncbi:ATP-binding cassette domain-containing protein, partial [Acinetobacter baumannii]|uniref:ATP-binding cassette domain-containing protein n=1 Tax=Acinetobacter baumannii TaxID=470 RepID=UPI0013D707E6